MQCRLALRSIGTFRHTMSHRNVQQHVSINEEGSLLPTPERTFIGWGAADSVTKSAALHQGLRVYKNEVDAVHRERIGRVFWAAIKPEVKLL